MSNIYDAYDRRLSSAWKSKVYDENGDEVTGDDPIIRDGHRLRVGLYFMDGKTVNEPPAPYQHADRRPREVIQTDAERERRQKLYADQDARVSNAWRNPPGSEGGEQ